MKIIAECHDKAMPTLFDLPASIQTFRHRPDKSGQTRRQAGAAAIEFALVFPLFFMIFYAIVTYGLIMVAQQSITLAAEEGARAALRHAADDATLINNARNAAIGTGSAAAWLEGRLVFTGIKSACPYNAGKDNCYRATVTYPNYRSNPLVPLILGPLMGVVVPEQLSSTATVQIN